MFIQPTFMGERLFAWPDETRANDFKLKEGRFSLDIRRNFFTQRGDEALE